MRKKRLYTVWAGVLALFLLVSCKHTPVQTPIQEAQEKLAQIAAMDSAVTIFTTEDGTVVLTDSLGNTAYYDADGNLKIIRAGYGTIVMDNSIVEDAQATPNRWTNSEWWGEPEVDEEISTSTKPEQAPDGTIFAAPRSNTLRECVTLEIFHTSACLTTGFDAVYYNFTEVNHSTILLENKSRKITGELKAYGRAAELELLDIDGKKLAEVYVSSADSLETLYKPVKDEEIDVSPEHP